MNERLLGLQPYPMVRLEERKAEIRARGGRIFDFGTGDPREPTPAFIREALLDSVPEISQYPSVLGSLELRTACATYMQDRFGVSVDPSAEVLPTAGSKEAIFHLPMVMLDPSSGKDCVVYGVPAYPVFEIGSLFAEAKVHEVLLDDSNSYLMDPGAIPAEVLLRAAVVFLNYPHNPSGQVMPPALFEAWVKARDEYGFLLVSDECYCDIYFEDAPRSLLEFGREGCLVIHSLSKRSGMTGYRSGFVAGDKDYVGRFRRFRAGMGVASQVWIQAAGTAAWLDGKHVSERRDIFAEKRRILLDMFRARGIEVYPGSSTLFLWAYVPEGQTDVGFADSLLDHGIVVSPGSFFGTGQDRFFRLALVPSLEECREVAEIWPR